MEFTYENLGLEPVMPKNKNMKIGIIGAGAIVRDCHLVAYKECGFHVHAITSLSMSESQALADKFGITKVYATNEELMDDPEVEILDIAVPPSCQLGIVEYACENNSDHIKGILCQKPLSMNSADARKIVAACEKAGVTVGVNSNMRCDAAIKALKTILDRGYLGELICANIDMHALPFWQTFLREYETIEILNYGIHHIDSSRFLFGDPVKVNAVCRKDPRTKFEHTDGISQYNLIYEDSFIMSSWDDAYAVPEEGTEKDFYINWRVAGLDGMAKGTIGWWAYPELLPSELYFTCKQYPGKMHHPTWNRTWFPDAFRETMAQLMIAVETGTEPAISAKDNLRSMAVVDAIYQSIREERTVYLQEIYDSWK